MATTKQRNKMAGYMDALYAARASVHYPLDDKRVQTAHQLSTWTQVEQVLNSKAGLNIDCSQMVDLICHISGLKSPNGDDYREDGFTGTLLSYAELQKAIYTNAKAAGIGALVVFGYGTGQHVAMVRHPDPVHGNPMLFSHGQESDPRFILLNDEARYHEPEIRFCSIAHL